MQIVIPLVNLCIQMCIYVWACIYLYMSIYLYVQLLRGSITVKNRPGFDDRVKSVLM